MVNLDNFFKRMLDLNTTAKKVSEKTGISTGNISDWKSGRCLPSAEELAKIADCLDCSVDYLLGRTNNPDGDFYIKLFSTEGLKAIRAQLSPIISKYGYNTLADELGIKETHIFHFIKPGEVTYGYKCLERLSSIFTLLDTNAYELIKKSIFKEYKDILEAYNNLSPEDQAEIKEQLKKKSPNPDDNIHAAYESADNNSEQDIHAYEAFIQSKDE